MRLWTLLCGNYLSRSENPYDTTDVPDCLRPQGFSMLECSSVSTEQVEYIRDEREQSIAQMLTSRPLFSEAMGVVSPRSTLENEQCALERQRQVPVRRCEWVHLVIKMGHIKEDWWLVFSCVPATGLDEVERCTSSQRTMRIAVLCSL